MVNNQNGFMPSTFNRLRSKCVNKKFRIKVPFENERKLQKKNI